MAPFIGKPPILEDQLRAWSRDFSLRGSKFGTLTYQQIQSTLDSILKTAHDPEVDGNHATTAILALSSLIQSHKSDAISRFWEVFWGENLWIRCFDVILDRSESVRPKWIRQFLVLLVSILDLADRKLAISEQLLSCIVHVLRSNSQRRRAKPALHALTVILSRRVVSTEHLVDAMNSFPGDQTNPREVQRARVVFEAILSMARFPELTQVSGKAASTVWRLMPDNEQSKDQSDVWIQPMLEALLSWPDCLPKFKSYVFPEMFLADVRGYHCFLSKLGLSAHISCHHTHIENGIAAEDGAHRSLLFGALEVGKIIGLVVEQDDPGIISGDIRDGKVLIHIDDISHLLFDIAGSVRVSGLSLLISSVSKIRSFSTKEMWAIRQALPYLIMESDASLRGELVSLFRKLVDRTQSATFALNRQITRLEPNVDKAGKNSMEVVINRPDIQHRLLEHRDFLLWMVEFLSGELQPEAGYQRHSCALKFLIILVESGLDVPAGTDNKASEKWPFRVPILSLVPMRCLKDLLMNPFEDIQRLSAALLSISIGSQPHDGNDRSNLRILLEYADNKLTKTGRRDHADGVSRIYSIMFNVAMNTTKQRNACNDGTWWQSKFGVVGHLIYKLELAIFQARQNMAVAISAFPMHGILSGLRYIVETSEFYSSIEVLDAASQLKWSEYQDRLVEALESVWYCVRSVLCVDAPEGYIPESLEDDSLNTKDILSYSWRALKESSELIKSIVGNVTFAKESRFGVMTYEQLDRLTLLSFTCLTELRHRGAFTTVAQTFASCCARHVKEGRTERVDELYENTLLSISEKGGTITRRSAGLPSLIVGILVADLSVDRLSKVIKDLEGRASAPVLSGRQDESLPQVHALNCLRSIFLSSALGSSTEVYIADTLSLAGHCLTSDIWAIRNCGLMLFRSLIDRLLGSSESQNRATTQQSSTRVSWNDHQNIKAVVLDLLHQPMNGLQSSAARVESVFPALKFVERIPPPRNLLEQIRDDVLKLCGSSHWHLRDLAARTYSSLVAEFNTAQVISDLLRRKLGSQNSSHGLLLCVKYILSRYNNWNIVCDVNDLLVTLDEHCDQFFESSCSPFTQATFFDILNIILGAAILSSNDKINLNKRLLQKTAGQFKEEVYRDIPSILSRSKTLCRILLDSLQLRTGFKEQTETEEGSVLYLERLGDQDANACCWVLEDMVRFVPRLPTMLLEKLSAVLFRMIDGNYNDRLLFSAGKLLRLIQDDVPLQYSTPPLSWVHIRQRFTEPRTLSPSRVESGVQLWAQLLSRANLESSPISDEVAVEITTLLATIRPLLDELAPFAIRYGAVNALGYLDRLLLHTPPSPGRDRCRRDYFLIVYDSLNDDDEEIRDAASKITSKILSALESPQKPRIPALSSRILLDLIRKQFATDEIVTREAIQRVTGCRLRCGVLFPPVTQRFEEAVTENTDLFATEKQNLYIDRIRESDTWSVLLKTQSQGPDTVESLVDWTLKGLQALLDGILDRTDGPLGWSSQPEMFVFATQVINAAEVLLQRSTVGISEELIRLVELGQQRNFHNLLIRKATNALQKSQS